MTVTLELLVALVACRCPGIGVLRRLLARSLGGWVQLV